MLAKFKHNLLKYCQHFLTDEIVVTKKHGQKEYLSELSFCWKTINFCNGILFVVVFQVRDRLLKHQLEAPAETIT